MCDVCAGTREHRTAGSYSFPQSGLRDGPPGHKAANRSRINLGTCAIDWRVRGMCWASEMARDGGKAGNPAVGLSRYEHWKGRMKQSSKLGVVIGVGNQKGGVGKTTNTVHLAAALGQRGYRCLIIDLDPAAGATKHLGVPENSFAGSLELLTAAETVENLAISDRLPAGVHLVPARPQLSELETVLSKFVDRTRILDVPLATARQLYDFVFLDTAPAPGAVTTVATYSSAEWFLLSAFPHPLSLGGLTEAFNDIADVRRHRNPVLEVLGVVFTNVDGRATRLRNELEACVAAALPNRQFQTSISQAVILPEVSGRGKTLFQLPKFERYPVALQYMQLAAEVEARVLNRTEFLAGTLASPAPGSFLASDWENHATRPHTGVPTADSLESHHAASIA